MKTPAKRPLTPEVAAQWARKAQLYALDALIQESHWSCDKLAFHGGTSLHLSWQSPRFSEDLDFLLSRDVQDLAGIMRRTEASIRARFLSEDIDFAIEMQDKTKDGDRMPVFHLGIGHPGVLGKTWVKIEFWRVGADYLSQYATTLRTPMLPGEMVGQMSHQVPAADLDAAFCDKLTAFATRPFLKWRDIFDLWWIGTQTQAPLDMARIIPKFRHHLSAYNTPAGLDPAQALKRFLDQDPEAIVAKADPDLRRWLPERIWERLQGQAVRDMVAYARDVLGTVVQALEPAPALELPVLPRQVRRP